MFSEFQSRALRSGRGAGEWPGRAVAPYNMYMYYYVRYYAYVLMHGMASCMVCIYGTYTVCARARDVSDFWEGTFWELLPQTIVAMRPLLYKVAASAETSDVTLNRKPRLVSIKCLTALTQ